MLDLERINERRDIVRMKTPRYPFMSCTDSALDLQDELGLVFVRTKYIGKIDTEYREMLARYLEDRPKDNSPRMKYWRGLGRNFTEVAHSINYDPVSGDFVDISGSQFHSGLDSMIVIPRDDPRIAFRGKPVTSDTIYVVTEFMKAFKSGGDLEGVGINEQILLDRGDVVSLGY